MVDVSIIIVHWNVPSLLEACLASIQRERFSAATEIIVVDNGSDTPALREVIARHPAVQPLFLGENRGYAAGCNAGLRAARGSAALLLNPDTEVLAGALETMWTTLRVARHVGMVAPILMNPNGSLQSAGYRFPGIANVVLDLLPAPPRLLESSLNGRFSPGDGVTPYRVDYPLGAAMLVRRAAWEDVGLLDEGYGMYCEEIDWARRFAERGWTILVAPSARLVHHGGSSTRQRAEAMRLALWESRARYLARWGTPRQRALIPRIVVLGMHPRMRRPTDDRRANDRAIVERFSRLVSVERR